MKWLEKKNNQNRRGHWKDQMSKNLGRKRAAKYRDWFKFGFHFLSTNLVLSSFLMLAQLHQFIRIYFSFHRSWQCRLCLCHTMPYNSVSLSVWHSISHYYLSLKPIILFMCVRIASEKAEKKWKKKSFSIMKTCTRCTNYIKKWWWFYSFLMNLIRVRGLQPEPLLCLYKPKHIEVCSLLCYVVLLCFESFVLLLWWN